MVLIECPTCRRRMDVVTTTCPGCGKALQRQSRRRQRPLIIDVAAFIGIGGMVLWVLWWLVTGPSF